MTKQWSWLCGNCKLSRRKLVKAGEEDWLAGDRWYGPRPVTARTSGHHPTVDQRWLWWRRHWAATAIDAVTWPSLLDKRHAHSTVRVLSASRMFKFKYSWLRKSDRNGGGSLRSWFHRRSVCRDFAKSRGSLGKGRWRHTARKISRCSKGWFKSKRVGGKGFTSRNARPHWFGWWGLWCWWKNRSYRRRWGGWTWISYAKCCPRVPPLVCGKAQKQPSPMKWKMKIKQ